MKEMSDHDSSATEDSLKNSTHRLKQTSKQKQQNTHDCGYIEKNASQW